MPVAVGPSELSLVLILLCVVVIPIAAVAFARSGKGLAELGKGTFAIDREAPGQPGEMPAGGAVETEAEREEEVRQMVEASAYRRHERGEGELDVQAEIDRILGLEGASGDAPGIETGPDDHAEPGGHSEPGPKEAADGAARPGDPAIRAEIRQLIVANNERRERRGEDPLDVESEVDRRIREWT